MHLDETRLRFHLEVVNEDVARDRRGDGGAVTATAIDEDGEREFWMIARRPRNEPGRIRSGPTRGFDRSRLSRERKAIDAFAVCGAAGLRDARHSFAYVFECRLRHRDLTNDLWLESFEDRALGRANFLNDAWDVERAAVNDGGGDVDHLQRCRLHRALTDTEAARIAWLHRHAEDAHRPRIGRPIAFVLTGKVDATAVIESKEQCVFAKAFVAQVPCKAVKISVA